MTVTIIQKHYMRALAAAAIRLALMATIILTSCAYAIAQTCTISSFAASYGTVDILGGASVGTSDTFSVSCSKLFGGFATIRLCVEIGPGSTALSGGVRTLRTAGNDILLHNFFTDAAYSTSWGSWGSTSTAFGTGGVQRDLVLDFFGNGTASFTAYPQLTAGQTTAKPGTYNWVGGVSPGVRYDDKSFSNTPCPTGAFTATSSGTVNATINANCLISTTSMNFGSAGVISANIDATATISVQCTNTTPYSLGLNNGANASGSQRRMKQGTSNFINYNLYTDASRTLAWSTGSSATTCTGGAGTCVTNTGSGANQNTTVYGRVPAQTSPAPGSYADTVLITLTY